MERALPHTVGYIIGDESHTVIIDGSEAYASQYGRIVKWMDETSFTVVYEHEDYDPLYIDCHIQESINVDGVEIILQSKIN